MKQQFLFSFKVLLKSKKFYNCIVFAIIVAFLFEFFMFKDKHYMNQLGTHNHAFFFISMEYSNLFNMFLISIPLLSILPFGDTYFKEKEFINQIFTRTSKVKYLIVNNFLAFITGFVFIFTFLGFMYFFNYLMLKSSIDNPFYYMDISFSENAIETQAIYPMFTGVLLENPALYNWIYIVILSAYAGLLSLTTYSLSLWIKNKLLTFIAPFAITILPIAISMFLPFAFRGWMTYIVFAPRSGDVIYHEAAIIFWISFFVLLNFILNITKVRKDVLE